MGVRKTIWFRGNKANQKWSADDIIKIFEELLIEVIDNDNIIYVGEAYLWLMQYHGISQQIRVAWINKIHNNNKRICYLWGAITQIIENRVVRDNEKLRPSVQGMVLQNKHKYSDKQEQKVVGNITMMPAVKKNGKKLKVDLE